MKTKANWPEKMILTDDVDPYEDVALDLIDAKDRTIQVSIYGYTEEEEKARASQICALTKMVKLLREIAEHDETFWYDRAQAILREIGEIE